MFDLTTTNSMALLFMVIPILLLFSLCLSVMSGKTTQALAIFTALIPLAIITIVAYSYPFVNVFVLLYVALTVSLLVVGRGIFLMVVSKGKGFKNFRAKKIEEKAA